MPHNTDVVCVRHSSLCILINNTPNSNFSFLPCRLVVKRSKIEVGRLKYSLFFWSRSVSRHHFWEQVTRAPGPVPGIGTKITAVTDPDGFKTVLVDEVDIEKELEEENI